MTPDAEPLHRFEVERDESRLDRFLSNALGIGRRAAKEILKSGRVRVGRGVVVSGGTPVEAGATVSVLAADPGPESTPEPSALPQAIEVVANGADWIAVAKPAGVHSVRGKHSGSVADQLEAIDPAYAAASDRPEDAGLVHRLDADTSGLLLAARTPAAWRRLRAAFSSGAAEKTYLALVAGELTEQRRIDVPLVRLHARVRPAKRHEKALPAATTAEPVSAGDGWTLVRATMRTGVTHQIRAHLAAAGHPLIGDGKYGGPAPPAGTRSGHLLHAEAVMVDGEGIDVAVGPPQEFDDALARMRVR